jgi:N-acetylmuramoyl-L-alanine amidase
MDNVQWLGSPNFTPNRYGHTVSKIVLHTMVGTIAGANSRFQNSSQQASAHYGVGLDGRFVQWVSETDAAWHAGNFNVNLDSIGIEHEDGGDYNGPRTPQLYQSSIALVRELVGKYHIQENQIYRHSQVSDLPTACPDALDTSRIITEAFSSTGSTKGLDMIRYVMWNGTQHAFRLQQNGTLVQAWYAAGKWNQQALGVGYVAGSLEVSEVAQGQLQVFTLNPDGSLAHHWQIANQGNWNTEPALPAL